MKISGYAVIHIDQNEGKLLDVQLYDNLEEAYQHTVAYVHTIITEEEDYADIFFQRGGVLSTKAKLVHLWDFGDYGIYIVRIL